MNELIKLNQQNLNGELVDTVNARELYSFLEVGRDFSSWIKERIEKYDFIENQDFIVLAKTGEKKIEYFISIDMAKELSMVERNEKGKQARKYFIECEKTLNQPMMLDTRIRAVEAYLHELKAHEETKVTLTHKKELAKLENAKSIYGASINQVKLKTGKNYNWYNLQRWCDENNILVEKAYPNGYGSISVAIYPTQAWLDIYNIDLNLIFKD